MSERKLKAWQEAGLIDGATASAIRDWEDKNSRPLGLWALIGLGALAIGLGLVSVIAANWDEIPGTVRLGIHFAAMIGLAGYIWWRTDGPATKTDYFHDAMLFIAGALGLTFFGHIGQVYQTNSPLWQPLLAWLLLFSPLLLLYGRGWPVAAMWMAGVIGTAWAHASEYGADRAVFGLGSTSDHPQPILYWGLISSPPMVVTAFAAIMRGRSRRPDFWRRLEQMAFFVIMVGLSTSIVAHGWGERNQAPGIAAIQSLILAVAAIVTWTARKTRSGQATAAILSAGALINIIQAVLPSEQILAALFFMALWGAMAYGAIHAGWRAAFQLAVGVLAVRLIILSFELADDLLGSGVGLILVGLFTLGIAWIAVRVSKRFAPPREVAA